MKSFDSLCYNKKEQNVIGNMFYGSRSRETQSNVFWKVYALKVCITLCR